MQVCCFCTKSTTNVNEVDPNKSKEEYTNTLDNKITNNYNGNNDSKNYKTNNVKRKKKNKYVAAELALFLGAFGAHRFYLGEKKLGIIYVCLSFCGLSFVIAFFEFIYFFRMSQDMFDMKYN